MKKNELFKDQLSRRYLSEDGWMCFCRACGKHKLCSEFYKKKDRPFGIDSRCKIHFNKRDSDDDGSMDYMKLNPLSENDFKGAKDLLIKLGYTFDTEVSIHDQFIIRHGLQKHK